MALPRSYNKTRFEFDLDADGKTEQVALLKPGNAYLALAKNNDGKINDGSELFGPSTGNGFNALAKYDEDGNQFIDEADSIYNQLRLWSIDAKGHEQLIGLGEKGVGAIYLGHLNTPFELQQNQQTLGDIVSSSVYLKRRRWNRLYPTIRSTCIELFTVEPSCKTDYINSRNTN